MTVTDVLINRIVALGRTDKERAKTLGVSVRTVTDYKAGKIPRIVISLLDQGIICVPSNPSPSHEADRAA